MKYKKNKGFLYKIHIIPFNASIFHFPSNDVMKENFVCKNKIFLFFFSETIFFCFHKFFRSFEISSFGLNMKMFKIIFRLLKIIMFVAFTN